MAVLAFKSRSSQLRQLLKVFKDYYDDPATLRSHEPTLRRLTYMSTSPQDLTWRGEALHRLALLRETEGNFDDANRLYTSSLDAFQDHERLGLARAMRDYGLFVARYHDPKAGLAYVEQALALHGDDLRNAKGVRQRRITESYTWRVRLLIDAKDKKAKRALVEFALTECQDCCLRDQQQAVEFVLPYTKGLQRQLLDARLIEINARRRKPYGIAVSLARFVIDIQLMAAGRLLRTVLRKE